MKRLTLGLCMAISLAASAQLADVGRPEAIMQGTHSDLYNPVLSRDGSKLLFSAADYSNLRIYDFASGAAATICTDARSGFDAQFTADGCEVIYVSQTDGADGRKYRRLRSYDIARGANANLTEPARRIERPALGTEAIDARIDGTTRRLGKRAVSRAVRTEGSTLYITVDGKESAYSPVASEAGYLWESLSPDGTKVMFVAAGKGIVVTDLKGNVLARPGNYEAPVWFGNDHIVAMRATDDGHQYRSSQILLLSADGSASQELTRPESMSMFPAASAEGGKVVYNTVDGRLYQLSVKLK